MRLGLTDDLVKRVSELPGLGELPQALEMARQGDPGGKRALINLTLPLSRKETWQAWEGHESADDITQDIRDFINGLPEKTTLKNQGPRVSRVIPQGARQDNLTNQRQEAIQGRMPPNDASSKANMSKALPQPSQWSGPWKDLAIVAEFPLDLLKTGDREILNIVDRVLIQGKGWGPNDRNWNKRSTIRLIPRLLAKHGAKLSKRTYQRSIRNLIDIGLLQVVETCSDGTRNYCPVWWNKPITDALAIWKSAATCAYFASTETHSCRSDFADSTGECRSPVAHPVPVKNLTTRNKLNMLAGLSRDTSPNVTLLTLTKKLRNASPIITPHSAHAPRLCLPCGQARRVRQPEEEGDSDD